MDSYSILNNHYKDLQFGYFAISKRYFHKGYDKAHQMLTDITIPSLKDN